MDPGTSEVNADAAYGMCSHEGHLTPWGRGDFAAATRVVFLVSHGDSRDQVGQAMFTLHGLEDG